MQKQGYGLLIEQGVSKCDVNLRIENCVFEQVFVGVHIQLVYGNTLCAHEKCHGTVMEVIKNQIPNPRVHGLAFDGAGIFVAENTKMKVVFRENEISNTRWSGIHVAYRRPPKSELSIVALDGNVLTDTLVEPPLSSISLALLEEKNQFVCTKSITGPEFVVQALFFCEQCGMHENSNKCICRCCAENCHEGHFGVYTVETRPQRMFCDCPDLGCKLYKK